MHPGGHVNEVMRAEILGHLDEATRLIGENNGQVIDTDLYLALGNIKSVRTMVEGLKDEDDTDCDSGPFGVGNIVDWSYPETGQVRT